MRAAMPAGVHVSESMEPPNRPCPVGEQAGPNEKRRFQANGDDEQRGGGGAEVSTAADNVANKPTWWDVYLFVGVVCPACVLCHTPGVTVCEPNVSV